MLSEWKQLSGDSGAVPGLLSRGPRVVESGTPSSRPAQDPPSSGGGSWPPWLTQLPPALPHVGVGGFTSVWSWLCLVNESTPAWPQGPDLQSAVKSPLPSAQLWRHRVPPLAWLRCPFQPPPATLRGSSRTPACPWPRVSTPPKSPPRMQHSCPPGGLDPPGEGISWAPGVVTGSLRSEDPRR